MSVYSIFRNLTATVLLVVSAASAQEVNIKAPELSDKIPIDDKVKVGVLDNGLTYFIRQNEKPEDRVQLRLVIKAGSVLEDEDQLGLAHFVEHMAFNGTEHFEKNELVDYLQSVGVQFGADLNAYTSFDETVYMLPIPTDDEEIFNTGLLVLEDWASGVSFEDEEIDKERGVVIEEWRLGRGANQRMRDEWLPVVLKGSRYADRLPIGTKEILESFEYEAARRFYNQWYRPDLMAVIAVGDIDVEAMEKEIINRFGKIPPPKNPRKRLKYNIPDHEETFAVVASDPEASYTTVQVYYKHDKQGEKTLNDYRDIVIRSLYNGMLSRRLQELTQQADPPFIFASSNYSSFIGDKDAYTAFAAVSEDGVEKGLRTLLIENERLKRHGFTQGELDRYKKVLLNNYEQAYNERDKTESERYAREYIRAFLDDEPIPGIEFEYKFVKQILPSIRLEEVNTLAKKWIRDKSRVVVVTGPEKENVDLPQEADIKNILKEAESVEVGPYADTMVGAELLENRPEPGKIVDTRIIENVKVTQLTLDNGARVVLKPTDFKNDEILMSAYAFGGQSVYDDEDHENASNITGIISESGVGDFSKSDLQKYLSGKTVRVSPYISRLDQGFNGNAAPKDLETMFQLIYKYFTDPRKDEEAFNSYVNKNKMLYQNLMSNPQYYYSDQVSRIMAQNHPRGGGFPKPEDYDKIDYNRAFEIFKDRFSDVSGFTFVIVGNFEIDEIKPFVKTYLGSLPSKGKENQWRDLGIRPPEGVVEKTIRKGKDPKSLVTIYFTGEYEPGSKNNHVIRSLGEALTIRLIEILREEKGGVYGVGASGSYSLYPVGRYTFRIGFPCAPENVEDLVNEVSVEIKKFKSGDVEEDVVTKVREQQRRNREENLKENQYWLRLLENYYYYNKDLDRFFEYEQLVQNLSLKDLQLAAQKYLNMNNYVKVVLLPEEETK